MSKWKYIITAAAIIFLHGCMAPPQVLMLGDAAPPKSDTEDIDIYYLTRPERDFSEIARIEVGDTNDEYSMEQILLKARGMGADGVIIVGRSGSYGLVSGLGTGYVIGDSSSAITSSTGMGVSEGYGLVAIAVRYK
jgi:hypothetical protein